MTVRVLLFGHYRDVCPEGTLTLDVSEGATIADVAGRLAERDARFADLLARTRVAINADFTTPTAALSPDDEVAFLPPMSGG